MSGFKYIYPKLRARILAGEETWAHRHKRSEYILGAVLSCPLWVDRKELQAVYAIADAMTISTGIRHTVDHIVPIVHPYVCGLSVPWNLQVLPHAANVWKGNRFHPDQLELFS